jgi:hypothetical protein
MKRQQWLRWPLLSTVLFSAACATIWTKVAPQRDAIRSAHSTHQEGQVECLACHEDIFEATALGMATLPSEKKCMECHKEQKAKGECGQCHTQPEKPLTHPKRSYGLNFDHASHLERNEDCGVCHKQLAEKEPLANPAPAMETCLGCHEHKQQFASGTCDNCHKDLQRFSLKPITSYAHDEGFLKNHASSARASGQSCTQCHDQSFCTDCHTGTGGGRIDARLPDRVDRQFIHFADYLSRHSTEARADASTCQQCHGQSSCQSCHLEQNLTPEGKNAMDPHPRGFNTPGSPDFHGEAARRDIASCASCHDQGAKSNCVECHRSGGTGGNPHPPGWSLRHGPEEINRNAMCVACHL